MSQLKANLRAALAVHEIGDSSPRVPLLIGIEAGASRRNPSFGRDAGHLRHHQPGPAHRAGAIVDQVEIVRHAVVRTIGRHGRDDDAVRQFKSAHPEWCEHWRNGFVHFPPKCTGGEFAFQPGQPDGIAQPQILVAHTLASRQQGVGELEWIEFKVAIYLFKPCRGVVCCTLDFDDFQVTHFLILLQAFCQRQIAVTQHFGQLDRVLECQLGARADGKMRGVCSIAQQDDIAIIPFLANHAREVDPCRSANMPRIGHQRMAAQMIDK